MPDRNLTDSEAKMFLENIDGVQDPQVKAEMATALEHYASQRESSDKAAALRQRRRLEDFYVGGLDEVANNLQDFDDPNGVARTSERDRFDALLALSVNPQEDTARFVNQSFIAAMSGQNLEDIIKNYDSAKEQTAKRLKINGPVTDAALFGALKDQVNIGRKRQEWAEALATEAFTAGVRSDADFQWQDFMPTMEQLKGLEGYDPQRDGDYAKIFQNAFTQGKQSLGGNREEFDRLFDYLGTQQGLTGFESTLDQKDVLTLLDEASKEDLDLFAQYAVVRGAELGLDKSFLQQSFESVWRGIRRTAGGHQRNLDRSEFLNLIRSAQDTAGIIAPVRVRPGHSGHDLEDVALLSPLTEKWPKATPEQKKNIEEAAETHLRRLDNARYLMQIAEGAIDPIKGENILTDKVWYPFLENAAFTGQAIVPYAGLPLLYSSVYDQRYEEIRDRNPEMERDLVSATAAISAAIEAPIERITGRLIIGKAPTFSGMFKPLQGAGTSGFIKRLAAATTIQAGEQFVQERLQDLTPLVLQYAAESLSQDHPTTDWSKAFEGYADSELDTFLAILPLALIGGGVATVNDFADGKSLLENRNLLEASGIASSWIDQILEEKSADKRQELYREAFAERDEEATAATVRQGEEALKAEREVFEAGQTRDDSPYIEATDSGFAVFDEKQDLVAKVDTLQEARGIVGDIMGFERGRDQQATLEAIDFIQEIQESGSSITFEDKPFTVGEARQENPSADIDRFANASAQETVDDSARVLGTNTETTANEVYSDVSRIYQGATPEDVFHERGHSYFKRQLQAGTITLDDVRRWKQGTDPNSERGNEEADLHEWLANQSVAYVTGRIDDETARKWIPESILEFFERFRQFAGLVARRAAEMMSLREQGKLGKDFEKHLARSVGLDESYRGEKHQQAEAARSQEQALLDVDRSPEKGLLKAVKSLGGIPTEDAALQGELDLLRQSFGGKWPSLARKKAKSLDDLRSDLVDLGFDFQTPSDVVDALDRASRGEEIFPTTFSVDQAQEETIGRSSFPADAPRLDAGDATVVGPTTFSVAPDNRWADLKNRWDNQGESGLPWMTHEELFEEMSFLVEDSENVSQQSRDAVNAWRAVKDTDSEFGFREDTDSQGEMLEEALGLEARDPSDPYRKRDGDEQGEPLTDTEIHEGVEDEPGTIAEPSVDDDKFSEDSAGNVTFSVAKPVKTIKRSDLKGKSKFIYFSDRTRVGVYKGLDESSGINLDLQGGPRYPYIKGHGKAQAGWAFTTEAMFTRFKKRVDESDGIGLVTLYSPENLRANPTFAEAYYQEVQWAIKSGKLTLPAFLKEANRLRVATKNSKKWKKGSAWAKSFSGQWKTLEDFRDAMNATTFEVRASMFFGYDANKVSNIKGSKIGSIDNVNAGFPDIGRMIDLFVDPDFKDTPTGTIVSAVQFEQGQPSASNANDIGAEEHLSYPVVIKGKPVGYFKNPVHVTKILGVPEGKRERDVARSAETRMTPVTFSISKKQDAEYLKAVESGDTAKAQEMVDEAAKSAGYDTVGHHFTDSEFTAFDLSAGNIAYFAEGREYGKLYGKRHIRAYIKTGKTLDVRDAGLQEMPPKQFESMLKARGVNLSGDTKEAMRGRFLRTDKKPFWTYLAALRQGGLKEDIVDSGFDTIRQKEVAFFGPEAKVIAVLDPTQIKSADPITYDDQGNVIPLSQRFDSNREEITFSIDPAVQEDLVKVEEATQAKRKIAKRVQTGAHKGGRFSKAVQDGLKNTLYERFGHQQAVDQALSILEEPERAVGLAWTGIDPTTGETPDPAVRVATAVGLVNAYRANGQDDLAVETIDLLAEMGTEGGKLISAFNLFSPFGHHGAELADPLFARHYAKRRIKKAADDILDGDIFRRTQEVFEEILGEEVRNRREKGGKKRDKKELSEALEDGLKERNLDTWPKAKKAINELAEKIDEGKLSPARVKQILEKTWKLPRWNKELEKQVNEWANKIAALPEYSSFRDEETIRFLSWLHDHMEGIDAADLAWSIWYANILSGYKTTIRNTVDSSANAALSLLMQGLSWNPMKAARRGVAVMGGLRMAVSEAFEEAKRSAKTGHSPFAGDKFRPGDSKNLGAASALTRLDNIKDPLARAVAKIASLDGRVRYVSNFLTAQDAFIGLTAKELRARMIAADKAETMEEAEALLALGSDVNTDINSRVDAEWESAKDVVQVSEQTFKTIRRRELRKKQRDGEIEARSADFATRVTYNYEPEGILGTLTDLIGHGLHSLDAGFAAELKRSDHAAYTAALWAFRAGANFPRLAMPFVRIIANLTNVGIDFSGVGLLKAALPKTITRKALAEKRLADKTVEQRQLEAKRGAVGVMMIGGLLVQLFPDEDDDAFIKLHGRGPQKFSDRQALRGSGWIPWSIQVGDRYYNYQNVPVAGPLAWIAGLHDDARYRREKLSDKSTMDKFIYGGLTLGKANLDRSALIGMADLMEIMGRDEMAVQRGVERWVGRTMAPSTAIPFGNLFRQIDETFDDTRSDRGTFSATILAQTPVLRRFNKPALDILGDEIENRPLDWITSSKQTEARLFIAMSKHQATPGDGYAWKNKMEPEQYYAFQKARGAFVKEKLEARIDAFERASQEQAQDWMRKVSRASVAHAKSSVGYVEE